MRTVVFTSDTHNWLLKGFFHQWKKYAKCDFLDVEVAGFTKPEGLPDDVSFYSLGKFADYPVNKWSDAVIKYLNSVQDELIMILLEDYWLMRPINKQALFMAYGFMDNHPDVIRFDVAADRMFSKDCHYAGSYFGFDLCTGKGQYSLSFQASIYRRKQLLEIMKPGESPWQAELNGTDRLNKSHYQVVGTFQWPINYLVAVNKGKLDRTGAWMYPARTLAQSDWDELDKLGYTIEPGDNHG
jgi:hypothetical protein